MSDSLANSSGEVNIDDSLLKESEEEQIIGNPLTKNRPSISDIDTSNIPNTKLEE